MSNKRVYGIVETDNLAGDYPNEKYIVARWLRKETADKIAKLLNDENDDINGKDYASRYYIVVMLGCKLKLGFEP